MCNGRIVHCWGSSLLEVPLYKCRDVYDQLQNSSWFDDVCHQDGLLEHCRVFMRETMRFVSLLHTVYRTSDNGHSE